MQGGLDEDGGSWQVWGCDWVESGANFGKAPPIVLEKMKNAESSVCLPAKLHGKRLVSILINLFLFVCLHLHLGIVNCNYNLQTKP